MRANKTINRSMWLGLAMLLLFGCKTTPDTTDQKGFLVTAQSVTQRYEKWVPGLSEQLDSSGGFIVFPDITRWGIIFGGGAFGRGVVCKPDGTQIGWAAINNGSVGLQAGIEGFKLMVVLQDQDAMEKYKNHHLSGSASAVIVVAEGGTSGTAPFKGGVAVYESAQKGLMVGINIGLDYLRFEPLKEGEVPGMIR